MNRLTLIIWTVAFVMICHLQGTAQNLVPRRQDCHRSGGN